MLRPPPSSTRPDTPFPDTPLFRSRVDDVDRMSRCDVPNPVDDPRDLLTPDGGPVGQSNREAGPVLADGVSPSGPLDRSEEHTSDLQSLMRPSYAVFCLKKKKLTTHISTYDRT